jgi:hypothetical protein
MADKTVMDMFADMAKQINLPKIDYEAFVDIHRKNIEAMQKSAAVLSESGRAVFCKGAGNPRGGGARGAPTAR